MSASREDISLDESASIDIPVDTSWDSPSFDRELRGDEQSVREKYRTIFKDDGANAMETRKNERKERQIGDGREHTELSSRESPSKLEHREFTESREVETSIYRLDKMIDVFYSTASQVQLRKRLFRISPSRIVYITVIHQCRRYIRTTKGYWFVNNRTNFVTRTGDRISTSGTEYIRSIYD